jgi:hypothetical protein
MKREELEHLNKSQLIDIILDLQSTGRPIGWDTLRELVWERDSHVCQVCGLNMREIKAWYDCGHIIDRSRGGADELDNLVVMCVYCNQNKPLHTSKEEYEQWLRSGYWFTSNFKAVKEQIEPQLEKIRQKYPEEDTDVDYDRLMRNEHLIHLQKVTGKPSNPETGWFNEFYCEWKMHE